MNNKYDITFSPFALPLFFISKMVSEEEVRNELETFLVPFIVREQPDDRYFHIYRAGRYAGMTLHEPRFWSGIRWVAKEYGKSGDPKAGAFVPQETPRLHLNFRGDESDQRERRYDQFLNDLTEILRKSHLVCDVWDKNIYIKGIYSVEQCRKNATSFRHGFSGDYLIQLIEVAIIAGVWPEYVKMTVLTCEHDWLTFLDEYEKDDFISNWTTFTAPEFIVHDHDILVDEYDFDSEQDPTYEDRSIAPRDEGEPYNPQHCENPEW